MNKRLQKQQSYVKKAKKTYHIGDVTEKMPAKLIKRDKLSGRKGGGNSALPVAKKGGVKSVQSKLYYKMAEKNPNPAGLSFPDNFMAIMGFKRVKNDD